MESVAAGMKISTDTPSTLLQLLQRCKKARPTPLSSAACQIQHGPTPSSSRSDSGSVNPSDSLSPFSSKDVHHHVLVPPNSIAGSLFHGVAPFQPATSRTPAHDMVMEINVEPSPNFQKPRGPKRSHVPQGVEHAPGCHPHPPRYPGLGLFIPSPTHPPKVGSERLTATLTIRFRFSPNLRLRSQ